MTFLGVVKYFFSLYSRVPFSTNHLLYFWDWVIVDVHRGDKTRPQGKFSKKMSIKNENKNKKGVPLKCFITAQTPSLPPPWIFNPCASMDGVLRFIKKKFPKKVFWLDGCQVQVCLTSMQSAIAKTSTHKIISRQNETFFCLRLKHLKLLAKFILHQTKHSQCLTHLVVSILMKYLCSCTKP